ncbi:hypothetical protein DFH11DRAFT_1067346 [Phellopilus nigrolimitatus]|nr:hypothetical protein DFH11DRAFT_1067346 [Phellopilus nigrolimitatus]
MCRWKAKRIATFRNLRLLLNRHRTVQRSSRFHMTARLAISDWSLRIPDGEVKKYEMQAGATHKWMISVRAPSYSVHASTVLANMTVSSATEPPPAAFITPLAVSEPPFCVMGLTEKPFLARITFEWAGTRNKATQVDHWIELDIGRSTRPVLGDEQVIDVELDRSTELLPRRSDSRVVDWQSDTDKKRTNQKAGTSEVPASASEPEHIKRLKKLLTALPDDSKRFGVHSWTSNFSVESLSTVR